MSPEERAALRALAEAATRGPWEREEFGAHQASGRLRALLDGQS